MTTPRDPDADADAVRAARPGTPGPAAADPAAPVAPATGSDDLYFTELGRGEEPVVTGTLFLTMIILMIIGGVWIVVYLRLLER